MTILPWTAHVSKQVRLLAMLRLANGWGQQEAPELNPVEYLWNWCKDKQLCNFIPGGRARNWKPARPALAWRMYGMISNGCVAFSSPLHCRGRGQDLSDSQ